MRSKEIATEFRKITRLDSERPAQQMFRDFQSVHGSKCHLFNDPELVKLRTFSPNNRPFSGQSELQGFVAGKAGCNASRRAGVWNGTCFLSAS
jgi:hypothetical protein